MPAAVTVEVTGLREVVRDLERVGVELADLKDAFGAIATESAAVAESYTPRTTGRLAATVRGNRAKNTAVVTFGNARVQYAGPVLRGWPARNIKAATTVPRTDAVMADRAPDLLERELDQLFTKYQLA